MTEGGELRNGGDKQTAAALTYLLFRNGPEGPQEFILIIVLHINRSTGVRQRTVEDPGVSCSQTQFIWIPPQVIPA